MTAHEDTNYFLEKIWSFLKESREKEKRKNIFFFRKLYSCPFSQGDFIVDVDADIFFRAHDDRTKAPIPFRRVTANWYEVYSWNFGPALILDPHIDNEGTLTFGFCDVFTQIFSLNSND